MKNLTKLALTGALIFGLNSCGNKKINEKVNSDSLEVVVNGTPYTLVLNDSALVLDQDYEIKIKRVKSGETKKSEKKLTELEKYNLENKQVYEDFLKFCNENPNKKEYAKGQYELRLSNKKYDIMFDKEGVSYFHTKNGDDFRDSYGDGLDDKLVDAHMFIDKNTNFACSEFIKDLPLEKQLSLAQEYTNALKEILHDAKYKNY